MEVTPQLIGLIAGVIVFSCTVVVTFLLLIFGGSFKRMREQYSMIERDVKQAVKLLEMSLSGLMSAENALKRWKTHIPPKAFEDIMACLTKGEMAHKPAASEQE